MITINTINFIVLKPLSQARSAFARILSPTGNSVTYLIPPLMANLLAHSEPSELADFMNFIGLLLHKLKVSSSLKTHQIYVHSLTFNYRETCTMC
jgi:hypothetical protein